MSKPNLVVLGGGAGGLSLVTQIINTQKGSSKFNLILIDRNDHHIWKPWLHKYVRGKLNRPNDRVEYRSHAAKKGYQFVQGDIVSVDRLERVISLTTPFGNQSIRYDKLVVAVGSHANDFGTPGVYQYCQFLDSLEQANALKTRVNHLLNRPNSEEIQVNIVGGGATGVELSAELISMSPSRIKVRLFEGSSRLLPVLPEKVSLQAKEKLEKLGCEVNLNSRITKVSEGHLEDVDGIHHHADLHIWSAGIIGPELLTRFDGLELTNNRRLKVTPNLRAENDSNVYAIGDCCACPQPEGHEVPAKAQAALQMAKYLAKHLNTILDGQSFDDFVYVDQGSIVAVEKEAFGKLALGPFLAGRLGYRIYSALYRKHQQLVLGTKTMSLSFLADWLYRMSTK